MVESNDKWSGQGELAVVRPERSLPFIGGISERLPCYRVLGTPAVRENCLTCRGFPVWLLRNRLGDRRCHLADSGRLTGAFKSLAGGGVRVTFGSDS